MPGQDQMQRSNSPSPQMIAALHRMSSPSPTDELALQVESLREEIAALRAELRPVPSLILTGRDVVEQFKRLQPA